MFNLLLAAVIELTGVTGTELRARAFFDANNVTVGDPLVLTVDFLGDAEFRDLHPPALSMAVNRKDWKIDDSSAKTSTYRDARRLTYRVRPMREGVLYFPALEFGFEGKVIKANMIPVHARAGAQVVVDEMEEAEADGYPKIPELISGSSKDFAWRKAMAHPSADAFKEFDTYEGRMNEAACALKDGNWSRALKIYHHAEWRWGQSPEIESGIVAALARKYENPHAVLPVWRGVFRPVLKYPWQGRIGIVLGFCAAFALGFWLVSRGIRAVAALSFILLAVLPGAAEAQDLFEQMRRRMDQMHEQMNQMMQSGGNFSFSFGEKESRRVPEVKASFAMQPAAVEVGEPFEFLIALEAPKTSSIGQIGIRPSENFGLVFTGPAANLTDGAAENPSNVIKRLSIPARYDVPYRGELSFLIEGMITGRSENRSRGGFVSSFSFSNSFRSETPVRRIEVKPLPTEGQPADFTGIISEGMRLHEMCDLVKVGTNDVITITYRLCLNSALEAKNRESYRGGYVPKDFVLPGAAFEWTRENDQDGRAQKIEYKRYFVADGVKKTPVVSVSYYDPRTKTYKTASSVPTEIHYD